MMNDLNDYLVFASFKQSQTYEVRKENKKNEKEEETDTLYKRMAI